MFDCNANAPLAAQSRGFLRNLKRSREFSDEISGKDVEKFPAFCKSVLKSGSYSVILLHLEMFKEWYKAFTSEGFTVLLDPLPFSYCSKTVSSLLMSRFPINSHQYALVLRSLRSHQDDILPVFHKPEIGTTFSRKKRMKSGDKRTFLDGVQEPAPEPTEYSVPSLLNVQMKNRSEHLNSSYLNASFE